MISGLSALDVPHVSVQSKQEAAEFIKAYGYDVLNDSDLNRIWSYHRKAVTYIQSELLKSDEVVRIGSLKPISSPLAEY